MRYSYIRLNFKGNNDLCNLSKKYLNDPLYESGAFFLKHPKAFDISYAFLPLIVVKLSMLKQIRFYLDHPVLSVDHVESLSDRQKSLWKTSS